MDNPTDSGPKHRTLPGMNRTNQPFSRTEALAAGVRPKELIGAKYQRLFRGVYLDADVVADTRTRARAALRFVAPEGFVSHHTAALIYGGVPPLSPVVHVSRFQKSRLSVRRGLMVHLASEHAARTRFAGIPISTPEQCFLEVAAAGANLVELVILGDSLVRKKRTTPEQLVDAAERSRGYRVRTARRAAKLVRSGVDSPMESRLRMLIVLAGLPEPMVNLVIWTTEGHIELRFDLWYELYKLIVEYDGEQHYKDARQRERDILRHEEVDRRGLRMIIFMANDIFNEPLRTLQRIRTALIECGAKGLPTTFRDEWRGYFPTTA